MQAQIPRRRYLVRGRLRGGKMIPGFNFLTTSDGDEQTDLAGSEPNR